MVKKGKVLINVFLIALLLFLPLIVAENIIYGDPLSPDVLLNSIQISSDEFYYRELGYIYVSCYNANNSLMDIDKITITPVNLTLYSDYSITTPISQEVSRIYKQGFVIENEEITSLTFNVVVTKGEKRITQDYTTKIGENTQIAPIKEKIIASLNFLYDGFINNWVTFLIVFLIIFMMVFIIKGVNYLIK